MSKRRVMTDTIKVEENIVIDARDVPTARISPAENEDPDYENAFAAVQEIRKREGVVGYILRGDSKATVDIDDPAKIIEYAMLSSQTFEAAETMEETFRLGNTESAIIEGKNLKVLCLRLGQNKISIFMEKRSDHTDILRVLASQLE